MIDWSSVYCIAAAVVLGLVSSSTIVGVLGFVLLMGAIWIEAKMVKRFSGKES